MTMISREDIRQLQSARKKTSEISQFTVELPDGRPVVVWRSGNNGDNPKRVAIVAPGFMRRMRSTALTARFLVDNGFTVYRCDYADHIGLSSGDIWDFTLSTMYESLVTLYRYVLAAEATPPAIVAASLSARSAFRLAAEHQEVAGIAAIVGVVDTKFTFTRVFGEDFSPLIGVDIGERSASFEGKEIYGRTFLQDWAEGKWRLVADTQADLARVSCPIVNFCGTSDDWVDISTVAEVFDGGSELRRIVQLPFVGHELAKNPVAAQAILREVTRSALQFTGSPEDIEVIDVPFPTLAAQVPYERRFEAAQLGRLI
jgi:pimeloyl-ACP methyl ester carboxylesterase